MGFICGQYKKKKHAYRASVRTRMFAAACAVMLLMLVSCGYSQEDLDAARQEGYDTGYSEGYDIGYTEGQDAGYSTGYAEGSDAGYDTGYAEVKDNGYTTGHEEGYAEGLEEGSTQGYDKGYAEGKQAAASTSVSASASGSSGEKAVSAPSVQETSATVYITATGSKYHRSGCSYLKKSCIATTLSDAKASGYTACSRCNPPA